MPDLLFVGDLLHVAAVTFYLELNQVDDQSVVRSIDRVSCQLTCRYRNWSVIAIICYLAARWAAQVVYCEDAANPKRYMPAVFLLLTTSTKLKASQVASDRCGPQVAMIFVIVLCL